MSDLLLAEGATIKAKEADNFAFLISDIAMPDGTPRLNVVASLADTGIYTTEDDLVYGMDRVDQRLGDELRLGEKYTLTFYTKIPLSHRWER